MIESTRCQFSPGVHGGELEKKVEAPYVAANDERAKRNKIQRVTKCQELLVIYLSLFLPGHVN